MTASGELGEYEINEAHATTDNNPTGKRRSGKGRKNKGNKDSKIKRKRSVKSRKDRAQSEDNDTDVFNDAITDLDMDAFDTGMDTAFNTDNDQETLLHESFEEIVMDDVQTGETEVSNTNDRAEGGDFDFEIVMKPMITDSQEHDIESDFSLGISEDESVTVVMSFDKKLNKLKAIPPTLAPPKQKSGYSSEVDEDEEQDDVKPRKKKATREMQSSNIATASHPTQNEQDSLSRRKNTHPITGEKEVKRKHIATGQTTDNSQNNNDLRTNSQVLEYEVDWETPIDEHKSDTVVVDPETNVIRIGLRKGLIKGSRVWDRDSQEYKDQHSLVNIAQKTESNSEIVKYGMGVEEMPVVFMESDGKLESTMSLEDLLREKTTESKDDSKKEGRYQRETSRKDKELSENEKKKIEEKDSHIESMRESRNREVRNNTMEGADDEIYLKERVRNKRERELRGDTTYELQTEDGAKGRPKERRSRDGNDSTEMELHEGERTRARHREKRTIDVQDEAGKKEEEEVEGERNPRESVRERRARQAKDDTEHETQDDDSTRKRYRERRTRDIIDDTEKEGEEEANEEGNHRENLRERTIRKEHQDSEHSKREDASTRKRHGETGTDEETKNEQVEEETQEERNPRESLRERRARQAKDDTEHETQDDDSTRKRYRERRTRGIMDDTRKEEEEEVDEERNPRKNLRERTARKEKDDSEHGKREDDSTRKSHQERNTSEKEKKEQVEEEKEGEESPTEDLIKRRAGQEKDEIAHKTQEEDGTRTRHRKKTAKDNTSEKKTEQETVEGEKNLRRNLRERRVIQEEDGTEHDIHEADSTRKRDRERRTGNVIDETKEDEARNVEEESKPRESLKERRTRQKKHEKEHNIHQNDNTTKRGTERIRQGTNSERKKEEEEEVEEDLEAEVEYESINRKSLTNRRAREVKDEGVQETPNFDRTRERRRGRRANEENIDTQMELRDYKSERDRERAAGKIRDYTTEEKRGELKEDIGEEGSSRQRLGEKMKGDIDQDVQEDNISRERGKEKGPNKDLDDTKKGEGKAIMGEVEEEANEEVDEESNLRKRLRNRRAREVMEHTKIEEDTSTRERSKERLASEVMEDKPQTREKKLEEDRGSKESFRERRARLTKDENDLTIQDDNSARKRREERTRSKANNNTQGEIKDVEKEVMEGLEEEGSLPKSSRLRRDKETNDVKEQEKEHADSARERRREGRPREANDEIKKELQEGAIARETSRERGAKGILDDRKKEIEEKEEEESIPRESLKGQRERLAKNDMKQEIPEEGKTIERPGEMRSKREEKVEVISGTQVECSGRNSAIEGRDWESDNGEERMENLSGTANQNIAPHREATSRLLKEKEENEESIFLFAEKGKHVPDGMKNPEIMAIIETMLKNNLPIEHKPEAAEWLEGLRLKETGFIDKEIIGKTTIHEKITLENAFDEKLLADAEALQYWDRVLEIKRMRRLSVQRYKESTEVSKVNELGDDPRTNDTRADIDNSMEEIALVNEWGEDTDKTEGSGQKKSLPIEKIVEKDSSRIQESELRQEIERLQENTIESKVGKENVAMNTVDAAEFFRKNSIESACTISDESTRQSYENLAEPNDEKLKKDERLSKSKGRKRGKNRLESKGRTNNEDDDSGSKTKKVPLIKITEPSTEIFYDSEDLEMDEDDEKFIEEVLKQLEERKLERKKQREQEEREETRIQSKIKKNLEDEDDIGMENDANFEANDTYQLRDREIRLSRQSDEYEDKDEENGVKEGELVENSSGNRVKREEKEEQSPLSKNTRRKKTFHNRDEDLSNSDRSSRERVHKSEDKSADYEIDNKTWSRNGTLSEGASQERSHSRRGRVIEHGEDNEEKNADEVHDLNEIKMHDRMVNEEEMESISHRNRRWERFDEALQEELYRKEDKPSNSTRLRSRRSDKGVEMTEKTRARQTFEETEVKHEEFESSEKLADHAVQVEDETASHYVRKGQTEDEERDRKRGRRRRNSRDNDISPIKEADPKASRTNNDQMMKHHLEQEGKITSQGDETIENATRRRVRRREGRNDQSNNGKDEDGHIKDKTETKPIDEKEIDKREEDLLESRNKYEDYAEEMQLHHRRTPATEITDTETSTTKRERKSIKNYDSHKDIELRSEENNESGQVVRRRRRERNHEQDEEMNKVMKNESYTNEEQNNTEEIPFADDADSLDARSELPMSEEREVMDISGKESEGRRAESNAKRRLKREAMRESISAGQLQEEFDFDEATTTEGKIERKSRRKRRSEGETINNRENTPEAVNTDSEVCTRKETRREYEEDLEDRSTLEKLDDISEYDRQERRSIRRRHAEDRANDNSITTNRIRERRKTRNESDEELEKERYKEGKIAMVEPDQVEEKYTEGQLLERESINHTNEGAENEEHDNRRVQRRRRGRERERSYNSLEKDNSFGREDVGNTREANIEKTTKWEENYDNKRDFVNRVSDTEDEDEKYNTRKRRRQKKEEATIETTTTRRRERQRTSIDGASLAKEGEGSISKSNGTFEDKNETDGCYSSSDNKTGTKTQSATGQKTRMPQYPKNNFESDSTIGGEDQRQIGHQNTGKLLTERRFESYDEEMVGIPRSSSSRNIWRGAGSGTKDDTTRSEDDGSEVESESCHTKIGRLY